MATGPVLRGIVLMSLAMLVIPVADGIGKKLGETYSPLYVSWARYIVAAAVVTGVAIGLGRRRLFPTSGYVSHALRTVFLMASMTLFFVAITRLPLATATASYFIAPFVATVLSILVLGERLSWAKVLALVLGAAGAFTILRPATGIDSGILLAMGAGVFFALYIIATRVAASQSDAVSTLVFQCVFGALLLTPQGLMTWTPPLMDDAVLFLALGAVSVISHLLSIAAFRYAEASTLAPLVYLELVSSAIIGYAVFGDVPGFWVWIGAGIIVAGGLLLLTEERRSPDG